MAPPFPVSETLSQVDDEIDQFLVAAAPFKTGDMIDYRAFAQMLASF